MKTVERENLKLFFSKSVILILFLILILLYPSCSYAQPLPPSKHILPYDEFVSSNNYAGDFVTVNAKLERIDRDKEYDWYRLRLLSLDGKKLSNKGWVLVNHSSDVDFLEGTRYIQDKDIETAFVNGDNVVIVGKADKIVGMNRRMRVNEEGTVILLLSEEEYEKGRSARGGKTVSNFSFDFDVVESYEVVGGELKMKMKKVTKKFFALGDSDLSLLDGNYELLDSDEDKLMSPLDPFPDTKDADRDGLDDKEEMEFRTHPNLKDTDRDGVNDYDEVKGSLGYKTNPISKDTDGDGLTDYEELFGFEVGGITYKTNPLKKDTDGDGKIDKVDDRPSDPDADKDGLSDIEEKEIGTDPTDPDTDDDGLTDLTEVKGTKGYVTDPFKKDTDGDGLFDSEEIEGVEILSAEEYLNYTMLLEQYGNELSLQQFDKLYISDPTAGGDKAKLEELREEKMTELKKAKKKIAGGELRAKIYLLIVLISIAIILIIYRKKVLTNISTLYNKSKGTIMPNFICPYCFEMINTRDICFRCINQNPSDCPLEEDKAYSNYRKESARPMHRVIKHDLPFYKKMPTHALCPKCNTKTTKIICPNCHNDLPHTTGRAKEYMVALIGAKEAGKSIYIAVLINALSQYIGQKLDASLTALNDETIKRYRDEFYKPLYEDKEIIKGTISATADVKAPLMYRFSIAKKNIIEKQKQAVISLVFFDTAGEDLDSSEIMRGEIKYIANASGIILLLDPLQIPAVRNRLPEDANLPNLYTEPEVLVTRVINLIREDHKIPATEKIKIPIALAFSKIDALRPILPPDSALNRASPHDDKFDIDDCELVSSEMQAYLQEWVGPGLNTIMEHNFQDFAYFGLSALGAAPDSIGKLTEVVSSFRIGDPFLWLLWKTKFIKGRTAEEKLPKLPKFYK